MKFGPNKPFKTFPYFFLKLPNKDLSLHKPPLPLPSPPKLDSQTKPKGAFDLLKNGVQDRTTPVVQCLICKTVSGTGKI